MGHVHSSHLDTSGIAKADSDTGFIEIFALVSLFFLVKAALLSGGDNYHVNKKKGRGIRKKVNFQNGLRPTAKTIYFLRKVITRQNQRLAQEKTLSGSTTNTTRRPIVHLNFLTAVMAFERRGVDQLQPKLVTILSKRLYLRTLLPRTSSTPCRNGLNYHDDRTHQLIPVARE